MNAPTNLIERDQNKPAARDAKPSQPLTIRPAVDVFEDHHGVTLWADLPGVTKDKLDIKVHDGNLYISAEANVPTHPELRLEHIEMRTPHFMHAFSLSADFDTTRIDANLQDGVLKLLIPRREEARPRRIEVKSS